ncbi:hypothetical protein AGMMS50276_01020 [Synergistales bacterium]|nr:hypothetical protein AGMMS50276_01020 [Synergistales bacterium]
MSLKSYADNGNKYEYVLFGRYPQDSDGAGDFLTQPILWRVLNTMGSSGIPSIPLAQLLSDKNLDAMKFDDNTPHWGDSSLRKWMNSEDGVSGFKREPYFTDEEQGVIYPMLNYSTSDENSEHLKGENGSRLPSPTCYFYPLTYGDDHYISGIYNTDPNKTSPNSRRVAKNTAYTAGKLNMQAGSAGYWWLRSPATITDNKTDFVWAADDNGGLVKRSFKKDATAVRPAFLLKINSLIFKSASSANGNAGSESNPYFLYLSIAAKDPESATVNGVTLTVTFNAADKVVHAYTDTPNNAGLAVRFTVKKNGSTNVSVSSAKVEGNNVVLTLASPIQTTDTGITVSYAHVADSTDGLGFLGDGKALSEFSITAPAITKQPTGQTATENGDAAFTVEASGAPAPTYQWQVSTNGTDFANVTGSVYSGATTATLTLTSVPASFNGYKYRCVASNGIGSVTSNTATLTVNYAQPTATINYTTEKLTGLVPNAKYNINNTEYIADENGEIELASNELSGSLTIVRVGVSGEGNASGNQSLTIPPRPGEPTGLNGVAPTAPTENDGKITGTTTEMEYKYTNDATSDWTTCAASQTADLAPGEYLVRVAATESAFVGAQATVYVKEATPAADIDYVAEQLTGLTSAAYLFNNANETLSAATRDIKSWITETPYNLSIVKVNAKSGANSEAQNLTIPARPAAPSVTEMQPFVIDGTGGIGSTTTAMEYQLSDTTDWTVCAAPSVTGLEPGTYYVRFAAVTDSAFSGLKKTLTLNSFGGIQEYKPNAAIDYVDEKLTSLTANAEYILNDGTPNTRTADGDGKIAIDTLWFGKTDFSIVKKGDGITKTNSEAQALPIPSRHEAPIVTATHPTTIGGTGEINNTTTAMEYKLSTAADWTICADSSVTGLKPDTYYVRVAAVAGGNGNFVGLSATVMIDQFNSTREPTPSVTVNYELEKITGLTAGAYLIDGVSMNVTGDITIDDAWFGTTLSIVKKGDGITTTDSEALNQNIPSRPASPSVTAIQPVTAGGDGGISGTTAAMDYKPSASAETAYAPCAETETTGLAPGVYDVRFRAVSGVSFKSEPSTVTIIAIAPTITTTDLVSGMVGVAYSQTLVATGDAPITWSLEGGSLPSGLTLSSAGVISGNPTAAGAFAFTVKASNGVNPDAAKNFSITIAAAPSTLDPLNNVTIGGVWTNLGDNASGSSWTWDALTKTLTFTGDLTSEIKIASETTEITVHIADNVNVPKIVKKGNGSLRITVETGKTLSVSDTNGPAVSSEGDIYIGSGTVKANVTGAGNTEPAIKAGGDITITGTANVIASNSGTGANSGGTASGGKTIISTIGGVNITSTGAADAINATGGVDITNGANTIEASGGGHAINAAGGNGAISITGGHTEITDQGSGTNPYPPAMSGADTVVIVNGQIIFGDPATPDNPDDPDNGDNLGNPDNGYESGSGSSGGCDAGAGGALVLVASIWATRKKVKS